LSNPRVRMMWESRIPLQKVAEPSEVASVIVFLTGDESSYITGAFIPVDGGLLAQ
jgi:meso-butanediol dehydrogenase/(S,S)-butanediol dehydrogenase/diacetyl reductase